VNGEEERAAQDEVDLLGPDLAVVGDGERDQVDVVAGQLQLRALVALLDVLGDQGVQAQLVRDGGGERRRRVRQVHPVARRRLADSVLEGLQAGQRSSAIRAPVLDPERDRGLRGEVVRRW